VTHSVIHDNFPLPPLSVSFNIVTAVLPLLALYLFPPAVYPAENDENWFRLKGDFGEDGKPALAFRLLDHWEEF